MRKINEIFYSLQGEGAHAGHPSVFVRFSGCNKRCPFCDTRHEEGTLMTDDDIIRAVKLYQADWVILTGGEPSLWIDSEFVRLLKKATGKKVAIETNGTNPLPPEIDWVTVSPKFGIDTPPTEANNEAKATEAKANHAGEAQAAEAKANHAGEAQAAELKVAHADELKVVDVGQDLEPYFALPCVDETTKMYLQPCYVPDEAQALANRNATVRRVLADPRWTLSVQLHRFLQIP